MINHPVRIEESVYDMLRDILTHGRVERDGKLLDFSMVQTIQIQGGKIEFNPPARVEAKIGPITVKTTISALKLKRNGIKVEIDNSPIDLELLPK